MLSTVTSFANPNPDVGGIIVKITGTNGTDKVTLYDDPANSKIVVTDDKNNNAIVDAGEQTDITTIDETKPVEVDADMKKGNDTFNFRLVSSYHGAQRSVNVDLRQGNDKFNFSSPTVNPVDGTTGITVDPNGADLFFGNTPVSFTVEGEEGNDNLNFDLSRTSVDTALLDINADTESGNDTVTLTTPEQTSPIGTMAAEIDPRIGLGSIEREFIGFNAELRAQIDVGTGNDVVNQNLHSEIHSSNVVINVLGDTGNDEYNDDEDFQALEGSRVSISADLGSGDDDYDGLFAFGNGIATTLTAPAPGVALPLVIAPGLNIDSGSQVYFNILGSTGKDSIDLLTRPNTIFPLAVRTGNIGGLLDIQLHGGKGDDRVKLQANPAGGVAAFGTFRAWLTGDDSKDKITMDVLSGGAGFGTFDLTAQGNGDNDTIAASYLDESEFGNSLAFGRILLDGGKGTDTYDTETAGTHPANFLLLSLEILNEALEPAFI